MNTKTEKKYTVVGRIYFKHAFMDCFVETFSASSLRAAKIKATQISFAHRGDGAWQHFPHTRWSAIKNYPLCSGAKRLGSGFYVEKVTGKNIRQFYLQEAVRVVLNLKLESEYSAHLTARKSEMIPVPR